MRKESKSEKQARHDFYEAVLATAYLFREGCWFQSIIPHKCDGPLDPCHLIDKQGLWAFEKELEAIEFMVYDVRNGVPGCRHIHNRFDQRNIRIYQDELPDSVFMFITDWEDALGRPGVLHEKLNRKCPKGARP